LSSSIFGAGCQSGASRYNLAPVTENKNNLLTVKFDLPTYAAFSVCADILNARSISQLVHLYVVKTVNDVRAQIGEREFEKLVKIKTKEILERGELKRQERQQSSRTTTTDPEQRPERASEDFDELDERATDRGGDNKRRRKG
jgi:hypothetical protein